MDYSCFSDNRQSCLAEPFPVSGFICEAYRVKIYGKLHFLKKLKKEHEDNILFREALRKEFEIGAQVRKSVDSPPGMLTEDHHHTVHEERQVCYSSHLRPKSFHL